MTPQEHISAERRALVAMQTSGISGSAHDRSVLEARIAQAIREAENAAYENAAQITETAPQHTNWRASREHAAAAIRSLQSKDTP